MPVKIDRSEYGHSDSGSQRHRNSTGRPCRCSSGSRGYRQTPIGVIAREGVVTLTETLTSYIAKHAAEEASHRVGGVKAVANDIEVELFPGTERSDANIAEAVVHALKKDAFIPIDKLEVTVSNGWVTLKGEVEWHYQREAKGQTVCSEEENRRRARSQRCRSTPGNFHLASPK